SSGLLLFNESKSFYVNKFPNNNLNVQFDIPILANGEFNTDIRLFQSIPVLTNTSTKEYVYDYVEIDNKPDISLVVGPFSLYFLDPDKFEEGPIYFSKEDNIDSLVNFYEISDTQEISFTNSLYWHNLNEIISTGITNTDWEDNSEIITFSGDTEREISAHSYIEIENYDRYYWDTIRPIISKTFYNHSFQELNNRFSIISSLFERNLASSLLSDEIGPLLDYVWSWVNSTTLLFRNSVAETSNVLELFILLKDMFNIDFNEMFTRNDINTLLNTTLRSYSDTYTITDDLKNITVVELSYSNDEIENHGMLESYYKIYNIIKSTEMIGQQITNQ
ncbi:hypothetical protein LCGC14_3163960, partial [marine sediment metagenome]